MTKKTNALRILESAGVSFYTREYNYDEHDLSATHAAELLGLPFEVVYKTLCVIPDGKKRDYVLCSIPAAAELSLKKVAALIGASHCEMAPLKDLFALTGYQRGGCSPLGVKGRPLYILHSEALHLKELSVSAGTRGMQVVLSPQDLLTQTGGRSGWITL